MTSLKKITPFLWFDKDAEEAVNFYTSVFKNSRVGEILRNGKGGPGPEGSVLTASFELEGQQFTAMNGGPVFKFNESVSFVVMCDTQDEVDYYWQKLTGNGGEESQCGWLKDRFGLSWQITPRILIELMMDKDAAKAQRVMNAMMQMRKIDIATLEQAAKG